MSTHQHLLEQEEVMAYLDGELPANEATKAVAHLQECRQCQQFAVDLRSVSQAMSYWEIEPFDRELEGQMLAALEEREQQQNTADVQSAGWRTVFHISRWPRWGWIAAATSIAVLAIVATVPKQARMPASGENPFATSGIAPTAAPRSTSQIPTEEERRRRQESQLASSLEVDSTKAGGADRDALSYARTAPETGTAGESIAVAPNAPMIARTAELAITTRDFEAARARIDEILKRQSGYVGQMNVSSPSDSERKLTAVLRVPADRLEAAIAELKKVGRVESESQAGEEVTSQYVDLQARLTNARNTEQRLTELLRTRTGKLEEVVAVEEKLSGVREEIERMEAEKKALTKRVDFGTLNLSLTEEHQTQMRMVPPSVGTRFHNAAVEGYRSVVDGVINVLLFFMSWGPSLLVWAAILFFPARYVWRRRRAKVAQ